MDTPLERLTEALADRYAIERELGAGGMATVYLAHDLKHDRKVAVKVLRPELAAVIGAERFLNEIKVTANLQHPHILPLHDSGEADSFLFYVMPYVEGESLREKMDREKQLSIEEGVQITRSVASALDYAHRQGVIHRDIKPENVLLHDGQPLVADFGIALAVSHAGGTRLTETGLSIGTPYYMSPEQAMGDRELDARSDVYSLGAMLYEMLTGDPPYTGSTAQAIVAKVITEKPASVTAARDTVPTHVAAAIMKSLAKLPADRFATAADLGDALGDTSFRTIARAPEPAAAEVVKRSRLVPALTLTTVASLILAALGWMRGPTHGTGVSRFVMNLPQSARLIASDNPRMAMSPDGSRLVYVGWTGERSEPLRLFVRHLDQLDPVEIAGTENASAPFFSPDGEWIGFFVRRSLRKVPVQGGASITLTETAAPGFRGGAWLTDGTIAYTDGDWGLSRVSEAGGIPEVVVEAADDGVGEIYLPQPVPDRPAVVAHRCIDPACDAFEIVAIDVESKEVKSLLPGVPNAWVSPTGHLLHANTEGALFAQPFDLKALELTGSPVPVLEGLRVQNGTVSSITLSDNGTLAVLEGASEIESQLVLVERDGTERPLTRQLRDYVDPRFSPDGRQLVVEVHDDVGNGHLWIYDVASETLSRLTYEGHDGRQRWSPDGRTIAFSSSSAGGWKGFTVPADGSAPPTLAIDVEDYFVRSKTWTADSRTVVFHSEADGEIGFALYRWDVGGGSPPERIVQSAAREWTPALSRDGAWLAYGSDESGTPEIYVRKYPDAAGRYAVSIGGGREPLWGSGNELFYRGVDGFYVARLEFEPNFRVLSRERLFDDSPYAARIRSVGYDVHPDGERFVFVKAEEPFTSPTIVLNWFEELDTLIGR
jgi:serine/threonine-protein kinase